MRRKNKDGRGPGTARGRVLALAVCGPLFAAAALMLPGHSASAEGGQAAAFAQSSAAGALSAPAPAPSAVPAHVHGAVATLAAAPLKGFVVVIDAGHQAHADLRPEPIGPGSSTTKPAVAGGTHGVVTHLHESVVNLRVALKLRDDLRNAGATVIMIRTTENVDIPNSRRAKIANAAHADLFIRLHCDGASSRSVHGFLTVVPARNRWTGGIVAASGRAGADIQKATVAATGAFDRGISRRADMSGFNWSKVPSVIVEMGLMTNPTEDRRLATASYESRLAGGLTAGIVAFARQR